jgi:hypothetical protein
MNEDFLQYVWQHQFFSLLPLTTVDGHAVTVESVGLRNTNEGADFIDVRAFIDGTLWVGCVEIHIRSSDWMRHGHHLNPLYNNVILHAVYEYDTETFNANKQKVPIIELNFDVRHYHTYNQLIDHKDYYCCHHLHKIDKPALLSWFERLSIERLTQKSVALSQIYAASNKDWEETLYRQLARNFGFGLNGLPFELLSKSLSLKILLKHEDNLTQIEALLFGQAGMLNADIEDDTYFSKLKTEYNFLRKKYNLTYIDGFLWKFLRLRPVNFPTIRLAQFAGLIHNNEHLFSQLLQIENIEDITKIFQIKTSEYWDTHYLFGKASPIRKKAFGNSAIHTVFINTVCTFLFFYGKTMGNSDFCDRAIAFLEKLPAEKNAITKRWETLGIKLRNAFISQSLLQLNNEYCQTRRCLQCDIGSKIIIETN